MVGTVAGRLVAAAAVVCCGISAVVPGFVSVTPAAAGTGNHLNKTNKNNY